MKKYFGLRGSKLNHATIALIVGPSFFCFGWNQAVLGGVLTLTSFVNTFPTLDTINTTGAERHSDSQIQGTVVALYTIGAMFGALSCIVLGDLLGRRRTIFLASFVTIIGAVLMGSAFSLAQMIVARLVLGLGTGGTTATVPVWQAEISRATHRGAHVVSEGIFIGSGIAVALWIDFALYFVKGNSVSWRFPLIVQVLFSLIVMVSIFTLPESPRWLLKKDREEEAREILAILDESAPNSATVNADVDDIRRSLGIAGSGSKWDLLKMGKGRMLNRTWLAANLQMGQQMCGINLITFYATTIFQQDLSLNATNSRILAAAMELMQPVGAFIALFTIDSFGRRKLMIFGSVGMMICMAILAGTTSNPNNTHALIGAIVFLFLFNIIFPIGFLGIPFLYATEVAPLHVRAPISGISVATTWVFNFIVAEITPIGFDTIKYQYYIIYACINAAMIPIVYFCYPETNGMSLEEMDKVFEESKNIFDPPRIARKMQERRKKGAHDLESPEETNGTWTNGIKEEDEKENADQIEHKNAEGD